ncbi:13398_t:CDS:1, partial [Gigaspora margarita]
RPIRVVRKDLINICEITKTNISSKEEFYIVKENLNFMYFRFDANKDKRKFWNRPTNRKW